MPPMPTVQLTTNSWAPFKNQVWFELADFLYTCNQMPAQKIDTLLDIWAKSLCDAGGQPLYSSYKDLYGTIDAIPLSNIKWQSFAMNYKGMPDNNKCSPWMEDMYDVWFQCPLQTIHNMLEFEAQSGNRCFQDFMLGDWASDQSDIIVDEHPECEGAGFVPVILGSDKMTVLVTTGQHDYYPLYLSLGNLHNGAQWSHCHGVALIGFLVTSKSESTQSPLDPYIDHKI
ncbi:hypothetical protein BJV74DRAFT_878340 [Russula compacta]|nr:hypothetical protein BJV74DRAFT_878340 [Russula compacta]